jgi:hypothetical protein
MTNTIASLVMAKTSSPDLYPDGHGALWANERCPDNPELTAVYVASAWDPVGRRVHPVTAAGK